MELFQELMQRLGFVGIAFIALITYLIVAALYEQFSDGEEWNGEWPFWRNK